MYELMPHYKPKSWISTKTETKYNIVCMRESYVLNDNVRHYTNVRHQKKQEV